MEVFHYSCGQVAQTTRHLHLQSVSDGIGTGPNGHLGSVTQKRLALSRPSFFWYDTDFLRI